MEPRVRVKLTAFRLQIGCSITELTGRDYQLANAKSNRYYLEITKTVQDNPTQFDANKTYTAKEAAEHLPYSYKTVLTWIKTRKLKASRVAGTRKFLVKGQAIVDFIDSGELKHLGSSYVDDLDPTLLDPANVYTELTEADLETLAISGKVLNAIFGNDR